MPLTQKSIDEMKNIYKRKYGEELSDEKAWDLGHRLIRLFAILTAPPEPEEPTEVRTASALTELHNDK